MARFFFLKRRAQVTIEQLLHEHLTALRARGYSQYTVRNRLVHIRLFLRWCKQQDIRSVSQITLKVLERYQRDLADYRKPDGQTLCIISQHARLVPLRVWFQWMHRAGHIRNDPAERLQLPRLGQHLPRNILRRQKSSASCASRIQNGQSDCETELSWNCCIQPGFAGWN